MGQAPPVKFMAEKGQDLKRGMVLYANFGPVLIAGEGESFHSTQQWIDPKEWAAAVKQKGVEGALKQYGAECMCPHPAGYAPALVLGAYQDKGVCMVRVVPGTHLIPEDADPGLVSQLPLPTLWEVCGGTILSFEAFKWKGGPAPVFGVVDKNVLETVVSAGLSCYV